MGSRLRHLRGQALCGNDGRGGAHEGRPYGDAEGERVCYGGEIPRLRFATLGMTGGGAPWDDDGLG